MKMGFLLLGPRSAPLLLLNGLQRKRGNRERIDGNEFWTCYGSEAGTRPSRKWTACPHSGPVYAHMYA